MMPPQYGSGWNPFEVRSYGYGPQLGCQIEVDSRGQILREMGELSLPPPFNEMYRFLFIRFPENPAPEWEVQTEQTLPAESWGKQRQPPYYGAAGPGSRPLARMAATRHEKYQLLPATGELARCRYQLTINSLARVEDSPRWQITATGEIQFHPGSGSLQVLEVQCTATWSTETVVRRTPMVLKCQRLEENELEAMLTSLAPKPPEALSDAQVRQLLTDLDSGDEQRSAKACNSLLTANVPSLSPEVLAMLAERINKSENMVRSALGRLLGQHATPQYVPLLLGLLKSSDSSLHSEAVKALGRLKDKRACEPLAEMVARGSDYEAAEALKQIGAAAEDPVLRLLKEKHLDTRRQACAILERVGTRRSLEPLREAALSSDEMLANAARSALQEIQARLELETEERR